MVLTLLAELVDIPVDILVDIQDTEQQILNFPLEVDFHLEVALPVELCLHMVLVVQMHSGSAITVLVAASVLVWAQVFLLKFVLSSFLKVVLGKCTRQKLID